jgi:hypothetical protein
MKIEYVHAIWLQVGQWHSFLALQKQFEQLPYLLSDIPCRILV